MCLCVRAHLTVLLRTGMQLHGRAAAQISATAKQISSPHLPPAQLALNQMALASGAVAMGAYQQQLPQQQLANARVWYGMVW